jgi:hypothetical protein
MMKTLLFGAWALCLPHSVRGIVRIASQRPRRLSLAVSRPGGRPFPSGPSMKSTPRISS